MRAPRSRSRTADAAASPRTGYQTISRHCGSRFWPSGCTGSGGGTCIMAFRLPELPYPKSALASHISADTLEVHHGKHHRTYVDTLNQLIEGKPEATKSLEDLIRSSEGPLFNNAGQHWNHTFYWSCMKPNGGREPAGRLGDLIKKSFGRFSDFKEKFSEA